MQTFQEYIAANELDWWIEKRTRAAVRKLIKQSTGVVVPKTKEESDAFFASNFEIYTVIRRKPISRLESLTDDQWDALRIRVDQYAATIKGKGIEYTVEVLRMHISTNKKLLKGLPKRLHYWE